MNRKLLLEDTFEFQQTPFLVRVEEREMYVNGKTGEVRGVNMYGAPTGMSRGGRNWVICDAIVARVRPDYPYTLKKEWPDNVDKHFQSVELLDRPVKRGWLITRYKTVPNTVSRSKQELARDAIQQLKDAYNNRDRVQSLTPSSN